MEDAPLQVSHIEEFLMQDGFDGLKLLSVDLPSGMRLLSAESVARHEKLESLSINATDENGWLLMLTIIALRQILEACQSLHTLKCMLPAGENEWFYVRTTQTSFSSK
jgi:hypothetical protein